MDRADKFHPAELKAERAPVIERVSLLHTLLSEPDCDFVIGDDCRTGSFRDRRRVRRVIHVPMRNENIIGDDPFYIDIFGQFIASDKRIEQYPFPVYFNQKTGLPEIC